MRNYILPLLIICAILFASFTPLLVPAAAAQGSNPEMVNIPGTHQDELGCSGDWQPDCEDTQLTYDPEDDVTDLSAEGAHRGLGTGRIKGA